MSNRTRMWPLLAALIGCMAFASGARACDTPVYRYAMYRWPAANYFVFFVHANPATAEQAKVNAALQEMEDAEPPKPNVSFYDIPAADIEAAPPIAASHWKKIGKPESVYIVIAPPPMGGIVHAGELTLADVKSMTASPARTQIASMLEEGMATVLVVLDSDAKAKAKKPADSTDSASQGDEQPEPAGVTNDAAAQIVSVVINNVRSGALELNAAPSPAVAEENEKELRPPHDIATLRVSRDDPKEKWLVKMLLAVEPDLHEFNQPMVFPVYGRGRVHPPFLGLGITPDNLGEAVQFLTGACSCTVKEENPGVDLLINYDWESAAITMAQKFGVEEGNEQLGAVDLFPELIIPGEDEQKSTQVAAKDPAGSEDPHKSDENAQDNAATNPSAAQGGGETESESGSKAVASVPAPSQTAAAEKSTNYSIWTVGGVLLLALGALFAATLIILRPR